MEVRLQPLEHLSHSWGKEAAAGGESHPLGSAEPPCLSPHPAQHPRAAACPHPCTPPEFLAGPCLSPSCRVTAARVPQAASRARTHLLSMQCQLGRCSHFTSRQRIHILPPPPLHLLSPGLGWRMRSTHALPGHQLPKRRRCQQSGWEHGAVSQKPSVKGPAAGPGKQETWPCQPTAARRPSLLPAGLSLRGAKLSSPGGAGQPLPCCTVPVPLPTPSVLLSSQPGSEDGGCCQQARSLTVPGVDAGPPLRSSLPTPPFLPVLALLAAGAWATCGLLLSTMQTLPGAPAETQQHTGSASAPGTFLQLHAPAPRLWQPVSTVLSLKDQGP